MSSVITLTPGNLHLTQSRFSDKEYMDLEVSISGEYAGSFTGYVDKRALSLIAAAPELLNAVRFLLSNADNKISSADVTAANAVIAKATGR